MAVFRAVRAHAGMVATMLEAFNTEFDTWTPPLDVLERRLAAMLDREDVVVLVSGDPDSPLGFALITLRPTAYHDGPSAVLDELYVAPAVRDRGHGTELVRAMFDALGVRGCGEIHINVDEDDLDARRFYESHGFRNHEPGTDERMLCYIQEL
ncbi:MULTISPECIES: GNAT family N-acetyltransferase [unclassified Serinicoccus]|uniref:GNAT family N-acetyltransferase n=1 Tax=unclassified Serinicoccus TaxID=2643101 RepID=UPI003854F522